MNTVNDFCQFSGLQISFEKTQIMPLGNRETRNRAKLNTTHPVTWVSETKVLGLVLVADTERLVQLNMSDLVKKLEVVIHSWKSRSLTPLGKIAVVNSLMISIFVYQLLSLPSPDKILEVKIWNLIKGFLWENRRAKVKYDKIIQRLENGGKCFSRVKLCSKSILGR